MSEDLTSQEPVTHSDSEDLVGVSIPLFIISSRVLSLLTGPLPHEEIYVESDHGFKNKLIGNRMENTYCFTSDNHYWVAASLPGVAAHNM